jgi:Transmembrane secretion effector
MALGGVIWGTAATGFGINPTLLGGAGVLILSLILAIPLSINFTGTLDFEPAPVTSFSHKLIYLPQPKDGPVAVTYEFNIDPARAPRVHQSDESSAHDSFAEWRFHLATP